MANPIDQLHLLKESEDAAISYTAKKALEYAGLRQTGSISQEEYQDIMEDLKSESAIANAAADLGTKQLLASAIGGAITLLA